MVFSLFSTCTFLCVMVKQINNNLISCHLWQSRKLAFFALALLRYNWQVAYSLAISHFLCARYLVMAADLNCDATRQAATTENEVTIVYDNFCDIFFQSLRINFYSCETYDLISNETFSVNSNIAHLIIHVNICSLQSYFQNLTQFLKCMKTPPSIIPLSETKIT